MFIKREPTVYDVVQELLDRARTFPTGSVERSNLLAEAQLITSVEMMNRGGTFFGAVNRPR